MPYENNNQPQQPDLPTEGYAKRRWDICKECPELAIYVCKKCGCFMPFKTRLRSQACPIGKWSAEYE